MYIEALETLEADYLFSIGIGSVGGRTGRLDEGQKGKYDGKNNGSNRVGHQL